VAAVMTNATLSQLLTGMSVPVVLDRSNTTIVGSNPSRGIDVCMRFSLLCCPVRVKTLRWADPPSKES